VQFWLIKPAEARDVVAAALMAAENQQTPTFHNVDSGDVDGSVVL
jgi:pyruvate/2-oxoacid:ferredoxin oxidoreductase alpha subunit